ncbi:hypothetical protein JW921_05505 [Candidatus Fermentibacterales bacterium]|nr:hypothetical protein [Candidatus Fermentibacterales bacterium]
MLVFPSLFENPWQVGRALYHLSVWAGGRRSSVWIPQFASLRSHVREISRSAAGDRVSMLARSPGLWSAGSGDVAASLPPADASALLAAGLSEAEALLELGYPEQEGLEFVTRVPQPSSNTRRTPKEMQAAIHHLGGDFGLFRELLRIPDPHSPALRVVFCTWSPAPLYEERIEMSLLFEGQTIPACVTFSPELRGYVLLVAYDLALRLRTSDGVPVRFGSFREFACQE